MFLRRKRKTEGQWVDPLPQPQPTTTPLTELYSRAATLAMQEVEHPAVVRECARHAPTEQSLFTMTYACFVLRALTLGFDAHWKSEQMRRAILAIRDAFAQNAWFDPPVFNVLWRQTLIIMPNESASGKYGGLVSPAADLLVIASMAGYALDADYEPEFGYHVTQRMALLPAQGQALAARAGHEDAAR